MLNIDGLDNRLNSLRAGVSGANDGIVSVAGLVMGVAGAGADRNAVLIAGVAAAVSGAISMAGAEYTSVSAQRDSEIAHGVETPTTKAKPWTAARSSFVAFAAGSILPLIAILGPWQTYRVPATAVAVIISLIITGYMAAKFGKSKSLPSIVRNVSVSVVTMVITYAIGALLGVGLS